jgi:hypothetical protein
MTSISKLLALAVFAAGAATIALTSPAQAQAERVQPSGQYDNGSRPVCCTPATRAVATGSAGWTLKLPNNTAAAPVPVVPVNPYWAPAIPGSKWIGPSANAGSAGLAIGTYVYSYRFCLCPLLNGQKTEPGSLTLRVYADDAFTAKLNGVIIGQKLTGWSFTSSSPPAPQGSAAAPGGTLVTAQVNFQCDNVLTFEVRNGMVSPTGLDVFGTITGYFGPQPIPEPGRPCNCGGGPRDPSGNPN